MPRTKLSTQRDAQAAFAAMIRSNCYALYGSTSKAAPAIGVSHQTMLRRVNHVDELSLAEIRNIRRALKLPKETMLKALEGLL